MVTLPRVAVFKNRLALLTKNLAGYRYCRLIRQPVDKLQQELTTHQRQATEEELQMEGLLLMLVLACWVTSIFQMSLIVQMVWAMMAMYVGLVWANSRWWHLRLDTWSGWTWLAVGIAITYLMMKVFSIKTGPSRKAAKLADRVESCLNRLHELDTCAGLPVLVLGSGRWSKYRDRKPDGIYYHVRGVREAYLSVTDPEVRLELCQSL
jgi:hypothetical protein